MSGKSRGLAVSAYRFLQAALVLAFCLGAGALYASQVAAPAENRRMAGELKKQFPAVVCQEEYCEKGQQAGEKSIPPLVDLAALQEKYPDVQGWLLIPGTGVDYPVLQSGPDDPEHYLHRDYKGRPDRNGSLFLQWDCDALMGENLVIYGHNMKSGAMFGGLSKYMKEDYCAAHLEILFQTASGVFSYTVVAALKADVFMFPFRQAAFQAPDGLSRYIQQAESQALSGNSTGASTHAAQVLTLVTCSYEWDGARNIIVAVRK